MVALAVVAEHLVVLVHGAFLGILVVGGFAARRWRWVWPVHLGMVGWAVLSVAFTWDCPLTDLQQALRAAAGRPPLPGGFIDTYVTGVLVPAGADVGLQIAVGLVVLTSWVVPARTAGTSTISSSTSVAGTVGALTTPPGTSRRGPGRAAGPRPRPGAAADC